MYISNLLVLFMRCEQHFRQPMGKAAKNQAGKKEPGAELGVVGTYVPWRHHGAESAHQCRYHEV